MNARGEQPAVAKAGELVSRDKAIQRFLAAPLPSQKEEAWRFTPPELFFDERLPQFLQARVTSEDEKLLPAPPDLGIAVVSDALPPSTFADALPDGVTFSREATIAAASAPTPAPADKFGLLLNAVAPQSFALEVAENTEMSAPLLVHSPLAADGIRAAETAVHVGAGASAHLVVWLNGGASDARYFGSFAVGLAASSQLALAIVQATDATARIFQRLRFELHESARLELTLINLGARAVRQEMLVDIRGRHADANIKGLSLTRGEQHHDLHSTQVHSAPEATSHLRYKQVLLHQARAVFDGMVQVLPKMHGSDAYQECHTLLLSPQARVHTVPRLEIATDDVRCGHGATVKELSPAEVFYLRSRGIREATARQLLVTGFLKEISRSLAPKALEEHIHQLIGPSLAEAMNENS